MPLRDLTNPDVIKFFIEDYEKTTKLRLKWNKLNAAKLKKAATFQGEEKGYNEVDLIEKNMIAGLPTIIRDNKVSAMNRVTKPKRDGKVLDASEIKEPNPIIKVDLGNSEDDPRLIRPATDLSLDPLMRPVDSTQKSILYKNLPDFGRKKYLKSRNRMQPEDKYYFLETSGWQCGWRVGDSYFGQTGPTFGRRWRLTRDTMCRSGPQPDPNHYQNPEALGTR